MNLTDNLTDYRDPNCIKYDHVVQSDYEEIFWVGIATIGLNAVYFGSKALHILAKLLEVMWVYRPYSTSNDRKKGTRDFTIAEGKQSVLDVLKSCAFTEVHSDHVYALCYFILVIRAFIGPVMEFVHVYVDVKLYFSIIDCEEDVPIDRRIDVNWVALLWINIFIVLGVMFLPVSASISYRRHREQLGSRRIKTFELVKSDVTLCLASIRVLCVLSVVDMPKNFLIYFYIDKFITEPEKQGRSKELFLLKNVSFVLIWSLALIIVFARTKRNASERFFSCNNWYMFLFRVLIFIVIPLIWFFSNLLYSIGVLLQLYNNTYANTTLSNCAKKCHLAKGITSGEFIDFCCLDIGQDDFFSKCNSSFHHEDHFFYEQQPFNNQCLYMLDYFFIACSAVLALCFLFFVAGLLYITFRFRSARLARLSVEGMIDMGYPNEMNLLHVAAYYGETNLVKQLLKNDYCDVNTPMRTGDTAVHLAASNGFSEVVYLLVNKFNADISKLNKNDQLPADVAELEGFELITQYLKTKKMREMRRKTIRRKPIDKINSGSGSSSRRRNRVSSNMSTRKAAILNDSLSPIKMELKDEPRKRPTTLNLSSIRVSKASSLNTFDELLDSPTEANRFHSVISEDVQYERF
ncbi:Oidioi.mRNA.OKI2018_I69.XSR.g16557.t1.cds [Oikopleura dioica]|uniref:Oidioi.mRNA.OKI2018_I69.XSR.g16557.t1.cds n=1 Tax=Oikopleura dioica TaxID=34765 RepID=A0ABN7SGH6_OIKDI|nr:Oidioi.mRNA.OKI2018_I69.XSR.g16557.t1.cds [Oikopleura dioica]